MALQDYFTNKYLVVFVKGKGYVPVSVDKLTPDQIRAALVNGRNQVNYKPGWTANPRGQIVRTGAAQNTPGTTNNTPATNQPINGADNTNSANPTNNNQPIDPRDYIYQSELSKLIHDRARALAEVESERATLPSLYNRAVADISTGYNRDTYDSNANLAARGIIRSGEFQRRLGDRLQQRARQTADIERQYGTGAQAALAARINDINSTYNLGAAAALNSAKERYAQNNPASTYIWQNVS